MSKKSSNVIETMPVVEVSKTKTTVSYADVAVIRVGTMGDKPVECRVQHEKGGLGTRLAVGVGYRTWADFKSEDVDGLCAFVTALTRDDARVAALRAWLAASSDVLR